VYSEQIIDDAQRKAFRDHTVYEILYFGKADAEKNSFCLKVTEA
jgi:hypothetical protein